MSRKSSKIKGLAPSPAADQITLLRRVTFVGHRAAATPDEVDAFLADKSPDAYEKVVDRLLASPHYGERWAPALAGPGPLCRQRRLQERRDASERLALSRLRDQAFNEDKPYDRFVREQIAGDELWPNDPRRAVATGFNRHYPDESNARNLMQRRQEILNDITDTVGSHFHGLTFGCARCHDHKFDPILQTDYYRLQAFFANTAADDQIRCSLPSSSRVRREASASGKRRPKTSARRSRHARAAEGQDR